MNCGHLTCLKKGRQTRTRVCSEAKHGGKSCSALYGRNYRTRETQPCPEVPACPNECTWGESDNKLLQLLGTLLESLYERCNVVSGVSPILYTLERKKIVGESTDYLKYRKPCLTWIIDKGDIFPFSIPQIYCKIGKAVFRPEGVNIKLVVRNPHSRSQDGCRWRIIRTECNLVWRNSVLRWEVEKMNCCYSSSGLDLCSSFRNSEDCRAMGDVKVHCHIVMISEQVMIQCSFER